MQRRVDREFACLCPCWILQVFFEWSTQGARALKVCSFRWQWKKYEHFKYCVSLVWHWSMCSGKFGQPAAPSERDETVTVAWRIMPNVCKISRKIANFCRISVTRAWRERDGSVTKHGELCWNTGGKSTFYFHIFRPRPFLMLTGISPSNPFFWHFLTKVA